MLYYLGLARLKITEYDVYTHISVYGVLFVGWKFKFVKSKFLTKRSVSCE